MANVGPYAWYIGSVQWSAVTAWATATAVAAGTLVRQNATPAVGNERVFIAIVAGTTHATTEPTWVVTKGAKTVDNTVTWQEVTGQPGVNKDISAQSCPTWVQNDNNAVSLGLIIYDSISGSLQIVSTAGTTGVSQPSFSATAGVTTVDNTVTWTSLGLASGFGVLAAPHARLQNAGAANWGAAGDNFWIADNHAQTQASAISITFPGTAAALCNIWCFDNTISSLPPSSSNLKADPYTTPNPACAQITTTGSNAQTWGGSFNCTGVVFNIGSGAVSVGGSFSSCKGNFSSCSIRKFGTSASSTAIILPLGDFVNSTVQFGSVSDNLRNTTAARWLNSQTSSAVIGTTVPNTLIVYTAGVGNFTIQGVDLTALGTGKTIVGNLGTNNSVVNLIGCKISADVTIADTPIVRYARTTAIWVGSSGISYNQSLFSYEGTLTPETTIVRTGGATDGTTPISWKIVTTPNSTWLNPLNSFASAIWNNTTGSSVTLTVYGIWGSGSVPNNDDIWIEAQYFGSSSSPMLVSVNDTKANYFATGTALASDNSTWGGSTTAFKMTVTFTPQIKGYVQVNIIAAKPSTTFYIDPQPVLS